MSTRRVPDRTILESYKAIPAREASDLNIGPARSKAPRPGALANANPEVPGQTESECYKVLPVRKASGLHLGPAASEALRPGALANANPESCSPNSTWKL